MTWYPLHPTSIFLHDVTWHDVTWYVDITQLSTTRSFHHLVTNTQSRYALSPGWSSKVWVFLDIYVYIMTGDHMGHQRLCTLMHPFNESQSTAYPYHTVLHPTWLRIPAKNPSLEFDGHVQIFQGSLHEGLSFRSCGKGQLQTFVYDLISIRSICFLCFHPQAPPNKSN